jgi:hypothetical protein
MRKTGSRMSRSQDEGRAVWTTTPLLTTEDYTTMNDDMTQLLSLADAGAFIPDLARFDGAGLPEPQPEHRNDGQDGAWVSWGGAVPFTPAGDELPPLRAAVVVAAALALAEEYTDAATAAKATGQDEAAADLTRAANAARKAAFQAEAGKWHWAGDVFLVQSASSDQAVYAVHRAGCHCKAAMAGRACFHAALRAAYERAEDELEAEVLTTLAA